MIKNFSLFIFLLSLVFSLSCNNKTATNTKQAANAEVKRGVKPVADNDIAVLDTDYGVIKIELYSNIAPKAVALFKELAREGYFNGIEFHRVNSAVIQAGDSYTKPGAQAIPNATFPDMASFAAAAVPD